jgi:hypothetical protein
MKEGATALRPPAALLAVVMAAGCAGASVHVTAERARYPLSMSDTVRDDTGAVYRRFALQKVGDFSASTTRVGLLYSAVTPRSGYDVSDEVNNQIAAAQGEAIINLTITVSGECAVLNSFPVLNILPFWPGCIPVTVTGDIVRRRVIQAPR